jgi:hypothetical protein
MRRCQGLPLRANTKLREAICSVNTVSSASADLRTAHSQCYFCPRAESRKSSLWVPRSEKAAWVRKHVSKAAAAAGPLLPGSPLLSGTHVQVHCSANSPRVHLRQTIVSFSCREGVLIIGIYLVKVTLQRNLFDFWLGIEPFVQSSL